jgi:DNA-binding GntR family transcriptional regulator
LAGGGVTGQGAFGSRGEPSLGERAPTALADDRTNTMATQLACRLRKEIVSGALSPGSKFNLALARERFGVSLSPLREALARLMAEGLVEFEDNRGYRVAPVSLANLAEVTQLRTEFECLALRNAIAVGELAWESDVVGALHRLNRIARDPARPETLAQWEDAHRDFHLTLIGGCNMPLLLSACRRLLNLNDRYRRIFLLAEGSDRNVAAEHGEIAERAVAREVEAACGCLRRHIQRTGTNLHRHLAERMAG